MDNFKKRQMKEQRQTEKWVPKIIRVNAIWGGQDSLMQNTTASKEGKKVTFIEIIEEKGNIAIGGSRYEHITKRKVEDVLMNRLRKVPFLPIYFYVRRQRKN